MPSTTLTAHVYVSPEVLRRLKVLAAERGIRIGDVVAALLDALDRARPPSTR